MGSTGSWSKKYRLTQVRFVPSEDALANGTHTTQIGTFDDNASVMDDTGNEVDPRREFSDGDLTVTVPK
ncbi:hypothetical protein OK016_21980 [Vibrio chagasii]|nr:hypothetical protein [Vibrio chagasii]